MSFNYFLCFNDVPIILFLRYLATLLKILNNLIVRNSGNKKVMFIEIILDQNMIRDFTVLLFNFINRFKYINKLTSK